MRRIGWIAIAFELALAVIAFVVGLLLDVDVTKLFWPCDRLPQAIGTTLLLAGAATSPLLLGLAITLHSQMARLVELRQLVECEFVPYFVQMPVWKLCVIGFTAGLGEEMLFRGVIQTAFVNQIGIAPALAIGIAAIIFGAMHFVTLAYVVLAATAGFYLGWLYHLSGQLVLPILVHGLYDSLAFIYLVRRAQQKNGPAANGQNR